MQCEVVSSIKAFGRPCREAGGGDECAMGRCGGTRLLLGGSVLWGIRGTLGVTGIMEWPPWGIGVTEPMLAYACGLGRETAFTASYNKLKTYGKVGRCK